MKRLNLLNARINKDFTQQEVADIIGVSKQHYSRIENGQQVGSVEIWDTLEDLFQIPQRQLREVEEQPSCNLTKKNIIPK